MRFAGEQHGGRHRQRRTHHTADEQFEAELRGGLSQQ